MKTPQTHYPSLFGFIFFAGAALLLLTVGIILGLSALFMLPTEGGVNVQSTIYSAAMFALGILLGFVAIVSLLKFLNNPFADAPVSTSFPGWWAPAGLLGAGLILLVGYMIQDIFSIKWLALPILTVPAVILPIWAIVALGARGLFVGSRWRVWGILGVSLTITPFLLFMLEVVIVIGIVVFVVIYVAANPQAAMEFENLSRQLTFIDLESEEQALRVILPHLVKPSVVVPALIFFSIVIPLLEELVKPLGVWLLVGKLDSAAQGFVFGALGGAGFALVETFNVSGQMGEWGIVLFTRIGTGLLHVTTSALMGGAIFLAVRERRYLRLLGTYLLVVLLHGLWNASALTVSFSALAGTYLQPGRFETLQWISAIGIVVLAVALFVILIASNRRYQKQAPVEETPAPTDDITV